MSLNRKQIHGEHPAIGDGWILLGDDMTIQAGDETACVSELRNFERAGQWVSADFAIGETVKEACEESDDMDGWERLFRRRKP